MRAAKTPPHANVALAPSQRVGSSKRGERNIIPITGGTVHGRITGKVLMGGADYQLLSPPASIDKKTAEILLRAIPIP